MELREAILKDLLNAGLINFNDMELATKELKKIKN